MTLEQLKQEACAAIDANGEKIIALADSIMSEPEMGFKEFKTAAKIKALYDELGLEYIENVAITGFKTPIKGKSEGIRVGVIGELDAVTVPEHCTADPVTGAAHCCGHHAQSAALAGVAIALAKTDIMKHLDGEVMLLNVPAEEGVELEWRNTLIQAGTLKMPGGKPQMILEGHFDDIDMVIMQHADCTENDGGREIKAHCGGVHGGLGVISKLARYTGKASHSANPHEGINALNAANIALMAINAQRETFRDEDNIRVHPIITKGGDLVNVVPADVRVEMHVRGCNNRALTDASNKVENCLKAGALAIGATVEITDLPLCMSPFESDELKDICFENLQYVFGEDKVKRDGPAVSTECADVSNLIPTVHMMIGGAKGVLHGKDFEISAPELSYLGAAKTMTCAIIDLLYNGAEKGKMVKEKFTAPYTKEEYAKEWCKVEL